MVPGIAPRALSGAPRARLVENSTGLRAWVLLCQARRPTYTNGFENLQPNKHWFNFSFSAPLFQPLTASSKKNRLLLIPAARHMVNRTCVVALFKNPARRALSLATAQILLRHLRID
ncbi:MAG: hypothetical protein CAK90_06765 [Spartobacteria bacterium AMD-G4]|nr:MAG: hypothetical protein CAK90_06765 [Spartobacteria bacterium AMD-G4]